MAETMRVAKDTNPLKLAYRIIQVLDRDGGVILTAIGTKACYQAVKALAMADQRYHGHVVAKVAYHTSESRDGSGEVTGFRFIVAAQDVDDDEGNYDAKERD